MLAVDPRALVLERGKIQYSPTFRFERREVADAFSAAVIRAVLDRYPATGPRALYLGIVVLATITLPGSPAGVAAGEGAVDLKAALGALKQASYSGPISVHAEYQTKDMVGAMRRDLAFLRTALEAACEHGVLHQQANPQAVALWRWRAQTLRQLAMQEQPPQAVPVPNKPKKKPSK